MTRLLMVHGLNIFSKFQSGSFAPDWTLSILGKILVFATAVSSTPAWAQTVAFEQIADQIGINGRGAYLGVAVGDYDQDNDDDLYFSNQHSSDILYENLGNGSFKDVTQEAGVQTEGFGFSAVWGDVDNDGDLDLFAGIWQKGNRLFLNNGDKTFENVTQQAGLDLKASTVHALMADVDNDGFLDIYLTVNDEENKLYRNNGNGTFSDLSLTAGALHNRRAMGAGFFDYDKDGDVDLYLVHDFGQANNLYQNDGNGQFVDVAAQAGVNRAGDGMGVAFGDYNNDGWLDMYITQMDGNLMYLNNGDGTFTDVTVSAGVVGGGMAWGCNSLDCDNDGWLDIFVANESKFWQFLPVIYPNMLFHNNGNGTFLDIALQADAATIFDSFGSATLDFNNDGWQDIVVANNTFSTENEFLRNMGGTNHWLKVQLEGIVSNRSAIGARVEAFSGDWQRVDEVRAGSGFNSQNSLTLALGLGPRNKVDSLLVYWPSGIKETYFDISSNQNVKIVETQGIVTGVTRSETSETLPQDFALLQNYPNPFNPMTTIPFELPRESPVILSIYNISGQKVLELLNGIMSAGSHKVVWQGVDRFGKKAPSGLYISCLTIGENQTFAQKMLMLK